VFIVQNEMIDTALNENNWTDLGAFSKDDDAAVYQLQSFPRTLYEQDIQCVVVRLSLLKEQAERRIAQDLDTIEEDLMDAVDQLGDCSFASEEDATEAAAEWLPDHDEHCFEIDTDVVTKRNHVTALVAHRRTGSRTKQCIKSLSQYSEMKAIETRNSAKAALC